MKKVLIALFAVVLVGCDSGGSSSGSNATVTENNQTSPEQIGQQYAGTYQGLLEVTYTATELGLSESRSEQVTVVIESNGNATIIVDGRTFAGSLDTDRITAVVNVDETYEDIRCVGRISVEASLTVNAIDGVANGNGTCTQGTVSTPVFVAGTLNATRQ